MGDPLVPMDRMKQYLAAGNLPVPATADEAPLALLVQQATDAFQRACNRELAPFQSAQAGRTEVQRQRGGTSLWLDYPPKVITSIKLGRVFTAPDETLDASDASKLRWSVGNPELVRVDGNLWLSDGGAGLLSWARGGPLAPDVAAFSDRPPSFVQIVYDADAYLPPDAALAVMRAVSTLWQDIGTEHVQSERLGDYAITMADAMADDATWLAAVQHHRREVYA